MGRGLTRSFAVAASPCSPASPSPAPWRPARSRRSTSSPATSSSTVRAASRRRHCRRTSTRRSSSSAAARSAPSTATLPPILKTIQFEFDKHGSVDTTGLPVCTAAKLQATTVPQARKLCPGAIVGTGFGHADRQVPRTGADPGQLADHHLQRAANPRRPERVCPRLHHGSGAGHLRRSDPDRNDSQRPLWLPRQRRDPEDRRRRRHPHLRLDPASAANGPTRASSTATSTPAAPTAACRRSAPSASRTAPCLRGTFVRPCQVRG